MKEYQIATEVFGRPAQFDPQSDSTVRVQAGRLRVKLAEYYATEGADDPVVVKLPKGSYFLSFEARATADSHQSPGEQTTMPILPPRLEVRAPDWAPWRGVALFLSCALLVALASIGVLLRSRHQAEAIAAPAGSGALRTLWSPFLSGPQEPLVIFSNAAFVGRPETGLRYFKQTDAKTAVRDHYTGVGEVLAVHSLDQVFNSLGRQVRVKRGSLLSLDDAKNTDLIFVGSPSENLALMDIPGAKDFVFERVSSGPRQGDLAIVNRFPQPGEGTTFLASRSDDPLIEDYAIVCLVPGLEPERSIMILAGTTTFGTQGAVEFVSRPDSVENLLKQLPAGGGTIKPFEALVHLKIARGVPVETELVAARNR